MTLMRKGEESEAFVVFSATLGLACMFAGIWLGDAHALSQINIPVNLLVMRIMSLAIYAAFFLLTFWFGKRKQGDLRWLFGISSLVGIIAFVAGASLIRWVLPGVSLQAAEYVPLSLTALLLTKLVGAPVSVGLVCVFARIRSTRALRACMMGMLGAFAIYALAAQVDANLVTQADLGFPLAIVLLSVSLLLGMAGMGGAPGWGPNAQRIDLDQMVLAVPGVVKRPVSQVLTPGFLVMVAFASMMLGFLRNGLVGVDAHANPAALAMLVVLLIVAAAWKGLRNEHVFYAALLFTAVGILLEPQLEAVSSGFATVLYGVGTALFEVVLWTLCVWAARNSLMSSVAAAGARFVGVLGHLLGTVIVVAGFALTPAGADAFRSCELFIMLVIVVMLVVMLKIPQLGIPFSLSADMAALEGVREVDVAPAAHEASRPGAHGKADVPAGQGQQAPAAPPAAPAVEEAAEGKDPCDIIAATYHLTTREGEVLELLARGRDMAFMESQLFISRNTLKMHIRHIYTKLDVHSKQDIIDMVEQLVAR